MERVSDGMTKKAQTTSSLEGQPLRVSHLEEQLCFALYRNSQTIIKKYQPYLSKMNLTYPQYLVYLALKAKAPATAGPDDGTTVKALGQDLGLDSGTLSPLLKRMEKAGYVSRTRAPEDERKVMISLTAQGHALEPDIAQMQEAVACSVGITSEEFRTLLKQLHHLGNAMEG